MYNKLDLPKLKKLKTGPRCFQECRTVILMNIPLVEAELDENSSFKKITFASKSCISESLEQYTQIE